MFENDSPKKLDGEGLPCELNNLATKSFSSGFIRWRPVFKMVADLGKLLRYTGRSPYVLDKDLKSSGHNSHRLMTTSE